MWIARDGILGLVSALRKVQREANSGKLRHPELIGSYANNCRGRKLV